MVCRFCGRDLDTGQVQARSGVMDGVKLGCGMFILLPILLLIGPIAAIILLSMIRGCDSEGVESGFNDATNPAVGNVISQSPP